jgi:transcriptional regulator with XRE-family HTH domain
MSTDMATHFGDWLRARRKALGLSANQVALEAEITRSYMSVLELGKQPPTESVLEKLAPVLQTPLEDIRREAMRDEPRERIDAAVNLAAEDASPRQLIEWARVHFRAKEVPPAERAAYLKELAELIQAVDDNWDDL